MFISNPSAMMLRSPSIEGLLGTLRTLNHQIGVAVLEDGTEQPLRVRGHRQVDLVDFRGETISAVQRGRLDYHVKMTLNLDPAYDVIDRYVIHYYAINSSRGQFLAIIAPRPIGKNMKRILDRHGHSLNSVTFTTQLQDSLTSVSGFTNYGVAGRNDRERVGGRVVATTRSPRVSIENSDIGRFVRNIGGRIGTALTWIGGEDRPDLTFWVYSDGRVYIKRPQVLEEWMLSIIDMVIRELP